MLFFSLLVVVVFSMAFDPTASASRQDRRRASSGSPSSSPLPPRSTSPGRASCATRCSTPSAWLPRRPPRSSSARRWPTCSFVLAVEAVLAPIFTVFYNLRALGPGWLLLLIMPLGTWALVVNGTFFAALGLRTRNRELLLPLVLFPISLPALLAMVQATSGVPHQRAR